MRVQQYQIPGLGHLSTLIVDDATGAAAVVDPRRDVDVYLEAAGRDDLRIEQVIETHLHNDYVSGGRDLAALTGATHVIGAGAELRYDARGVRGGDTIEVGGLRLTVLDTPGHTPESVSYTLADTTRADEPLLMLTGGSLLVGAVGRTDLLGAENAPAFSAAMYRSLHDVILPHEDSVAVYPTHGAGSLCSTGIGSTTWSTIGYERRHDPLLAPMEVDAFARALLHGQPAFPRYFARMRPINQSGPRLLGGVLPVIPPLAVADVVTLVADGGLIVDARRPDAHAAGHIPGSLSIPLGSSFGTWLGWVTDHDRPLALVVDDPADLDELQRHAYRIGHESIVGMLDGGIDAWRAAGHQIEASGSMTATGLAARLQADPADRPFVIDVRQPAEYDAGHVPAAVHIGAGALTDRLDELPRDRPIAVICASGYRASVGASILRAAGFTRVDWVADGFDAWAEAGLPAEWGGSGREATGAAHDHAGAPHSH
jgi:hydroxyacylglutathione hydrolase